MCPYETPAQYGGTVRLRWEQKMRPACMGTGGWGGGAGWGVHSQRVSLHLRDQRSEAVSRIYCSTHISAALQHLKRQGSLLERKSAMLNDKIAYRAPQAQPGKCYLGTDDNI